MDISDVLIVGGGPAGLVAAEHLAHAGLKVILLEKRPEIGAEPLRCGEAFGPESDWPEFLPLDPAWIESEIGAVIVESPMGTQYNIITRGLGWSIDKKAFEQWLAKRAVQAGAVIHVNTYAIGAHREKEAWCVTAKTDGEQTAYSAGFIIGADGPESRVGAWTGIRRKWQASEIVTTAQVYHPIPNYNHKDLHFFVGPKFIPEGYGWIFPGVKGIHNIGVGTIASKRKSRPMEDYLRDFLKKIHVAVPPGSRFSYGVIPISGFDGKIVGDHSLLAGDAAGMVYPLSDGGIFNALHGGRMAAEAIVAFCGGKKRALSQYPGRFRKRFWIYFAREKWGRRLMSICSNEEIEEMFRRTQDSLPRNPYAASEGQAVWSMIKAGVPFLFRKFLFPWLALLVVFGTAFLDLVHARPDTTIIRKLQDAVRLGESQDYSGSLGAFDTFIQENPGEPMGAILKMSVVGLMMLDLESSRQEKEFMTSLRASIASVDSQIRASPEPNAWLLYAKGAAIATLSSHWVRTGKYWRGLRSGMESLDCLNRSLSADSTLKDGLLYLGLYDYVKGEMQRRLKWFLFWKKGEGKQRGIQKLETCRQSSLFSRIAATQVLVGIYARENDRVNLESAYGSLLRRHPLNRAARWTLANSYFEEEKWRMAAPVFRELEPLLKNVPGMASWQHPLCLYRLARCEFELGNYEQCLVICAQADAFPDPDNRRANEIGKDLRKLRKKARSRRKK